MSTSLFLCCEPQASRIEVGLALRKWRLAWFRRTKAFELPIPELVVTILKRSPEILGADLLGSASWVLPRRGSPVSSHDGHFEARENLGVQRNRLLPALVSLKRSPEILADLLGSAS